MWMQLRRLIRLTNAFFEKWENLKAALRVHQGIRVTTAMEARLTDHVWVWEELLEYAV
jgi:hypothetical protein